MIEGDTSEISVVICSLNRRDSLLLTLDSLEQQVWSGTWEVLVVDNGGTDGSFDAVCQRASASPVPLRAVREETRGLSHARNRALREARGRAVVFVDDDVTCLEGWLAGHGQAYRDAEVVGTGGPILPAMPSGTPEWLLAMLPHEIGGPTSRYDFGSRAAEIVAKGSIPLPFGANMGVLREKAVQIGGFRTDLGWGKHMVPSEELEFFRRIRQGHGRIMYIPTAALEHRIDVKRTTWDYYVRWQRGYGRSVVMMDKPTGFRQRLSRIRWCLRRMRRCGHRARDARSGSDRVAEITALRESERCRGQLYQLLRP